jgi:acyl-CoA thioesterase FadM
MNLYLRLLYVVVASVFRPRLPAGKATSELVLVTLPNDLDINFHVNNGRYLTLCDLSRMDLFMRTGLVRLMIMRGWMPVIAEHTMSYRKPLGAFRKFRATTHLSHWDEKYFFMTHNFAINGKIIAEGTSKGAVKGKDGVIPPHDVIAALLEIP